VFILAEFSLETQLAPRIAASRLLLPMKPAPGVMHGSVMAVCARYALLAASAVLPSLLFQSSLYFSVCPFIPPESGLAPDYCASLSSAALRAYPSIQARYWNVGWFRYYELRQLPNFALAAPILLLCGGGVVRAAAAFVGHVHGRRGGSPAMQPLLWFLFPFFCHLCALLFVCVTVLHVQVSTRFLLSASPLPYWMLADLLVRAVAKQTGETHWTGHAAWIYCAGFAAIGTILFSAFYPWT
jgi:phosphatidylinositol glycan class V